MIEPITKAPFGYRNAVVPSDMGNLLMELDFAQFIHAPRPPGFHFLMLLTLALSHTKYFFLCHPEALLPVGPEASTMTPPTFRKSKVIPNIRLFLSKVF